MKNNQALEILKQTQEACQLANQEYLSYSSAYEKDFVAVSTKYDEKKSKLKLDRDLEIKRIRAEYKKKLKEVDEEFRQETRSSQLTARQKKCDELGSKSYFAGSAYHSELQQFIREHRISDELMEQLLEKETGKQWRVARHGQSDVFGFDSVLNSRYFSLSLGVFLVNSDHEDFNGIVTASSAKDKGCYKNTGCYEIIKDYIPTVPYYCDMEFERKSYVKNYKVDWLRFFLENKGFIEKQQKQSVVAKQEIRDLICQAIENQYFNKQEDVKQEEKE